MTVTIIKITVKKHKKTVLLLVNIYLCTRNKRSKKYILLVIK